MDQYVQVMKSIPVYFIMLLVFVYARDIIKIIYKGNYNFYLHAIHDLVSLYSLVHFQEPTEN